MRGGGSLMLRGSARDGAATLRMRGNAVTASAGLRAEGDVRARSAGAPHVLESAGPAALEVVTASAPGDLASPRRVEIGQQHFAFYPHLQASMRVADAWVPVQLVLSPLGGGAWLPEPANGGWTGLSIGTRVCNTSLAFECTGNAVVRNGTLTLAALAARASLADDAAAAADGVPVGGLYSNSGAVQVRLA